MSEWLQSVSRSAEGSASRSTALQPLLWLVGIAGTSFTGSAVGGAALWAQIFLATMLFLSIVFSLILYCVFARKDTDLLRSEKFVLKKLEIEQAAIGDNLRGLVKQSDFQLPKFPQSSKEGINE